MEKLYRVVFDTQRNRRQIAWGYYVMANNQKEAKDAAFRHWESSDNHHYNYPKPHMFHTEAKRIPEENWDRDMRSFYVIESRYASWGR